MKKSWLQLFIFYLFLYCTTVYAGRDYYEILGINRDATSAEIKRAFRKLSLKHHPDKNPGDDEAQKKFAEVASAYDVLSDEEKKATYDRYGEDGLNAGGNHGGGHDPFDIFSQFFGGGRGRQEREPSRGPDIIVPLRVQLKDIYNGKILQFSMRREIICSHCHGHGAADEHDIHTCKACGGHGIKLEKRHVGAGFIQQVQVQCETCHGKGKIASTTCPVCGGKKVEMNDISFDIDIERGLADGSEIIFENYGDEYPGQPGGHVRFQVTTAQHPVFSRDGDHLWMEMHITLREALVGFQKTIEHLDKRQVIIARTEVTPPHYIHALPNEGMPRQHSPSEKGLLFVKFHVTFPDKFSSKQKQGLRELFESMKQ